MGTFKFEDERLISPEKVKPETWIGIKLILRYAWKRDIVFSRFRDFSFTITLVPEPEAQRSYEHALSLSCNSTLHECNTFGPLNQDYCERKTVKSWKDDIYCSICIVIALWLQTDAGLQKVILESLRAIESYFFHVYKCV